MFHCAIAILLKCKGLFDERDARFNPFGARFDLSVTANNFFEDGFDLPDAHLYCLEGENHFSEGKSYFSDGKNHFSEVENIGPKVQNKFFQRGSG